MAAGEELRVKFYRKPETVSLVEDRLDAARAQAVARLAREGRAQRKLWRGILRDPEKPVPIDGKRTGVFQIINRNAIEREVALLADPTHRQPRKKALWIAVRPSKEPPPPLPTLQEVAKLAGASQDQWAQFIRSHGLLEFGWKKWGVVRLGDEDILHIPLSYLEETADKATVLVAATKAAVGYPRGFEKLPFPPIGAFAGVLDQRDIRPPLVRVDRWKVGEPPEEARRIIALALQDALSQVEAVAEPGDRGIPERWAFYARGCWPLVVLSEFVHKQGYIQYTTTTCVAPGCSNPVPVGRYRYCSNTCIARAKKQRQREKNVAAGPAAP